MLGQMLSFRGRQISLLFESSLQFKDLKRGNKNVQNHLDEVVICLEINVCKKR